jgi:Tfp pilus assembly protein PilF
MARAYMQFDQPKAVQTLEEVISEDPTNYKAQTYLGQLFLEMKEFKKAELGLKAALKLNKQFPLVPMGTLLFETGNPDKALRYFNQAIKLNPKDGAAHSGLGNIY